jgi:hypothetical protein
LAGAFLTARINRPFSTLAAAAISVGKRGNVGNKVNDWKTTLVRKRHITLLPDDPVGMGRRHAGANMA